MEIIKGIIQKNCIRLLDSGNVNISELARLTKISPSTIHKWKEGKHAPELPNIEKLAEAMGISPLAFLETGHEDRVEPVSATLKKLLTIPDRVYALAPRLQGDVEAWEGIIGAIEEAIEHKEGSKPKKKQV